MKTRGLFSVLILVAVLVLAGPEAFAKKHKHKPGGGGGGKPSPLIAGLSGLFHLRHSFPPNRLPTCMREGAFFTL